MCFTIASYMEENCTWSNNKVSHMCPINHFDKKNITMQLISGISSLFTRLAVAGPVTLLFCFAMVVPATTPQSQTQQRIWFNCLEKR